MILHNARSMEYEICAFGSILVQLTYITDIVRTQIKLIFTPCGRCVVAGIPHIVLKDEWLPGDGQRHFS